MPKSMNVNGEHSNALRKLRTRFRVSCRSASPQNRFRKDLRASSAWFRKSTVEIRAEQADQVVVIFAINKMISGRNCAPEK